MHMRSSLHFSIAAVIAFFTWVPAVGQEFHPYPEWGLEVWAGPDMVFNKRTRHENGKMMEEYRSIDGRTGELRGFREEGPFSPTGPQGPRYRQVVNWNGKTYRLGHITRKEGKARFIDILLTGMSGSDLSYVTPEQPIASIEGEWPYEGHTVVDHRISPDGSKLLVYVYGIIVVKKRSWVCVVLDSDERTWSMVQPHFEDIKPAKDYFIDNQGVVHVLMASELFRVEENMIEQFKIEVPTEGGLWAGSLQSSGSRFHIFGFIGEKYFKEPKLVFMEFDPAARSLTAPKFSDFPYLHKFVPKEVIVKKADDVYWLSVNDRRWNPSFMPPYSATKNMFICRIHLDGSLEWAMHMPKMMTSYSIDMPDVILHPKDDQLIVLFQDHPDALEARQKGEEPKYGINPLRYLDTEYEIIQMTVSPDQKTEYKWFEVDGARSRWGYVQQIDEDTYFSGNAHKDEKNGFFYWTF